MESDGPRSVPRVLLERMGVLERARLALHRVLPRASHTVLTLMTARALRRHHLGDSLYRGYAQCDSSGGNCNGPHAAGGSGPNCLWIDVDVDGNVCDGRTAHHL